MGDYFFITPKKSPTKNTDCLMTQARRFKKGATYVLVSTVNRAPDKCPTKYKDQ